MAFPDGGASDASDEIFYDAIDSDLLSSRHLSSIKRTLNMRIRLSTCREDVWDCASGEELDYGAWIVAASTWA